MAYLAARDPSSQASSQGVINQDMGTASKKILRCAEKLDMRLIPHLEALEAKANAIVSISAVDIEAEERRQRQERAQVQLIQDSQKLFHLQYQVKAATHLCHEALPISGCRAQRVVTISTSITRGTMGPRKGIILLSMSSNLEGSRQATPPVG